MRGLVPGLTDQSVASAGVELTAEQIQGMLAAELTLQETGGTLTADGTEQILYIEDAPLGCFEPRVLFVDLDNMVEGNTTIIRIYYCLFSGGTLKVQDYQSYTGVDGGLTNEKLIALVLYPNRFGIKITLQQTDQDYKDFNWEVLVEG